MLKLFIIMKVSYCLVTIKIIEVVYFLNTIWYKHLINVYKGVLKRKGQYFHVSV